MLIVGSSGLLFDMALGADRCSSGLYCSSATTLLAVSGSRSYSTVSAGTRILVVDTNAPGGTLDIPNLTWTPTPVDPTPDPPTPDPPATLSRVPGVHVSPRDRALHVRWGRAAGDVSQYRVHAEDAAGRFRRVYTEPDVFEAVVDGLANGVRYTVTVTALAGDPGVEGPASEPAAETPGRAGGPTPDPAPTPALPLAGAALPAPPCWRLPPCAGARRRAAPRGADR